MEEKEIGKITHFFGKISVAVIELSDNVKIGDKLHVKGATSDFEQELSSMQIDHKEVQEAKAQESIGLKVNEPVREGDMVYRVEE